MSSLNLHATPFYPRSESDLTLITMNCRSLVNKLAELSIVLESTKPSIVCLMETWLCPSVSLHVPGYSCFRRDRPAHENRNAHSFTRGYGGVAVLVRTDAFQHILHRPDLQRQGCESTWVEVKSQCTPNPILVCCMYRPPSQTVEQLSFFSDMLVDAIQSSCYDECDFFLTGDFNAKHNDWCSSDSTSTAGTNLQTVFSMLGLQQLVSFPTYTSSAGANSCLDLLVTNKPRHVLSVDHAVHLELAPSSPASS